MAVQNKVEAAVPTGRYIGSVVDIKDGQAIQDSGVGHLVSHPLEKFESPPKVGDKIDVSYVGGVVKAFRNMTDELARNGGHAVNIIMHVER